jgi:hypothetical protein
MDSPGDEVRQAEVEVDSCIKGGGDWNEEAEGRRRFDKWPSGAYEASFCAEKGAGREHEETYLRSIYGAI